MRHLVPVNSTEISVVIQGPLCRDLSAERNIFTCIASVRAHLPKAEIIVATWRHEDVSGIEADQILSLEDPGCIFEESGNPINTNRMLHSTLSGIKVASRPYVMKLRSDHNLTSAALAVIGQSHDARSDDPRLFDTPITLTTLYMRDPKKVPMLFHISDLVQFGTTEAMRALWDQPLLKKGDILHHRPFRNPFGNFSGYSAAYRIAEQCLMLGAMRKQGIHVHLGHPCQTRLESLKLWESVLRSNFNVLDHEVSGVDFPERFLASRSVLKTLYKASNIEQMHVTGPWGYRLKITQVWFNQYLLSCLRLNWWVSLASMILFTTAPRLAKTVRSYWRMIRKVGHPGSYRV